MNNYEKIKSASIYEMAIELSNICRSIIENILTENNLQMQNYPFHEGFWIYFLTAEVKEEE